MNHHVRNFFAQMTVVYIDWLPKESWLKHWMSTFFGAIETLFWDDKARSRLLKIPDRFKWYWITSWMGIKMVEYVAYLIYFHLPSEKRSPIFTRGDRELKKFHQKWLDMGCQTSHLCYAPLNSRLQCSLHKMIKIA